MADADDQMMCEVCGKNPARRSDQEYRESHPDDKWAVMCEDCDKNSGGASPPRPRGSRKKRSAKAEEVDVSPQGAEVRLAYQAYSLRLEAALYARSKGEKVDGHYSWMNDLNEDTIKNLTAEIMPILNRTYAAIYLPWGPARCKKATERTEVITGAYQLMSGLGNFTGVDPRESVKALQSPTETVQTDGK